MQDQINSIAEIIENLPVDETAKQALRETLKNEGEEAVKPEIHGIMLEAAELLKQNEDAEELLPLAEQSYEEELNGQELEQVREKLS